MAAKLLSPPHPHPFPLLSLPSKLSSRDSIHHRPWPRRVRVWGRPKRLAVGASLQDSILSSSSYAMVEHLQHHFRQNPDSVFLLADSVGYSFASYYTSLGLFVLSVPGLWSLIKRSVKSKIVQKTFIAEGEAKKAPNQVAGEILSFFTRNSFAVTDKGETITFEGMMVPSRGQAALLTFCTCISLASVGLVLTITFPLDWFF